MIAMGTRLIASCVFAALALWSVAPAIADERHDRGERGEFRRGEGWHDRDIHRFRDHDFGVWRSGRWVHGRHEGRAGWWWVIGPSWYFYPAPIYPYPDPYVPPYAASGASAWYYCPSAGAYYPYVASCPVPWQVVPAQ